MSSSVDQAITSWMPWMQEVSHPAIGSATSWKQPNHVPDQDEAELDGDLRKRARFLQQSKKSIWKRWSDEYLRGLRERHNMTHKGKDNTLSTGDVVIIKGEDRNRAKWKIGIVEEVITGRDGVVRGARLRA